MAINFTESADKHGIPHKDSEYAVLHHINSVEIVGRPQETTRLFVGRPHAQSQHFLEVAMRLERSGKLTIFHSMQLSDKWRWLLDTREH